MKTTVLCMGIGVCIVAICIILLIFAPKLINFYDEELFPAGVDINNDKHIKPQICKEVIQSDIFKNDNIIPIYYNNKLYKDNKNKVPNMFKIFQHINNIKSLFLVNIPQKTKTKEISECGKIANNTIRCAIVLSGSSIDPSIVGVMINGESKALIRKNIVVFDASQPHSIYNKTNQNLKLIIVDIPRPKNIKIGNSQSITKWVEYENLITKYS